MFCSDSNVEVRLKLLNEIGSTSAVINNFNDINPTVTKSNISTHGRNTLERFKKWTSYS